jgi:hypothetical protein
MPKSQYISKQVIIVTPQEILVLISLKIYNSDKEDPPHLLTARRFSAYGFIYIGVGTNESL